MRKELPRRLIPALLLGAVLVTALTAAYVLLEIKPIGNVFGGRQLFNFSGGWEEVTETDLAGGSEGAGRSDSAVDKEASGAGSAADSAESSGSIPETLGAGPDAGFGGEQGAWSDRKVLSKTLPETLEDRQIICFETRQQALRVYIDGKKVYEAGTDPDTLFGRSIGSMWNLVPLRAEYAGKTIAVELLSAFRQVPNQLQEATLGDAGSVLLYLLYSNVGAAMFSCFTALLGILLLILAAIQRLRRIDLGRAGFFNLGVFSLLASVWVLTDSRLLQLFTGHVTAVYILSFFTFMLLPVPFLQYLKSACPQEERMPDVLSLLFLLDFAVIAGLHVSGVRDLVDTVIATHLLLLATIVWILFVCVRGVKNRKKGFSREIYPALCILCAFVILSLLWFYFERPGDYARFFRWGLFIFIILLSAATLKRAVELLNVSAEARMYKVLAFADAMTMLLNRAAFNRDIEEIKENAGDHKSVTLALFDLNNLKWINDTLGHQAGDEVIVKFAEYLRGVFSGTGQSYRIGGDEFAVLIYDRERDEIDALVSRLRQKARQEIDFAWGFQRCAVSDGDSLDMDRLFAAADRKMYEEKGNSRRKRTQNREENEPQRK